MGAQRSFEQCIAASDGSEARRSVSAPRCSDRIGAGVDRRGQSEPRAPLCPHDATSSRITVGASRVEAIERGRARVIVVALSSRLACAWRCRDAAMRVGRSERSRSRAASAELRPRWRRPKRSASLAERNVRQIGLDGARRALVPRRAVGFALALRLGRQSGLELSGGRADIWRGGLSPRDGGVGDVGDGRSLASRSLRLIVLAEPWTLVTDKTDADTASGRSALSKARRTTLERSLTFRSRHHRQGASLHARTSADRCSMERATALRCESK